MPSRPLALLAAAASLTLPAAAQEPAPPHVPGELVIRFASLPTEGALADIAAIAGGPSSWTELPHAPFARESLAPHPLAFYRLLEVGPEQDLVALAEVIGSLPTVAFAATNNTPEPTSVPNDPLFAEQWSHTKMNSLDAWAVSTGSTEVIVGIIDSGCVIGHEDLQAHVWVNDDPPNGVDDDGNGFVDDTYGWDFASNANDVSDVFGHGTQVAGIVGAPIDNGLGVAGIANVTVMVSKWWHTSGTDATVAASVYYAVDNGAHVLNLSLGCQCLLPMSEEAINYAHANGVLVVSSAGNASSSVPGYPAGYANSMAVSAINQSDLRPGFSNFGPHIDLGAPSPNILSTGDNGPTAYDGFFRGTSASSPHVAGVAALVLSVDPTLTPNEVRALINENAFDLGARGFDVQFGHGRLDAGATLAALLPPCPADLDASGDVGVPDLAALITAWGACTACEADLDANGLVDVLDLAALIGAWGPCGP